MDETYTPQPDEPTPAPEETESARKPIFTMRRAGAAAGILLGIGAGTAVNEHIKNSEFDLVHIETVVVQSDEELTSTVEHAVEKYFTTNNLDLTKIPYATISAKSTDAAAQMNDHTSEQTSQPGEQFTVSIQENEYDTYSVDVEPAWRAMAVDTQDEPASTVEIPTPKTH